MSTEIKGFYLLLRLAGSDVRVETTLIHWCLRFLLEFLFNAW